MRDIVEKFVKVAAFPLASLVLVAGAGCKSHHDADAEEDGRDAMKFNEPDELSPVNRLVQTQANEGARTDATLRAYHFQHGRLNSLGRERLDQITAGLGDGDDSNGNNDNNGADLSVDDRLVVYLDLPAGETDSEKNLTRARQDAVTNYLVSKGLSEGTFKLESGYNKENTSYASSLRSKDAAAATNGAKPASTSSGSGTSTTSASSSSASK